MLHLLTIPNAININQRLKLVLSKLIAPNWMFYIPQHSKKLTSPRLVFVSNCLQVGTMYFMLRYKNAMLCEKNGMRNQCF
jgi:hypothetical protein